MSLLDYAVIFLIAVLGQLLQMLLKIKSLQEKARKANVKFSTAEYLRDDWASHGISIVTILLFMFFVREMVTFNAAVEKYLRIGFAFVGYSSADIASRIFSVVNRRINDAIDFKTTQSDTANGTLDQPTPTK
jgi:hypothetical protein